MCGFVGQINIDVAKSVLSADIRKMNQSLIHRGPDEEGYFIRDNIGIGHRRLSIIDRSSNGRQPIHNEEGSVLAVLNGEIYNFKSIRNSLQAEGHRFTSNTDTEVIVHAYEKWDLFFLNRLDGMFSLALFDDKTKRLILATDPFGKKPLFYTRQNGAFLFASELKAFSQNPAFKKYLNVDSVLKYFAYEYIPSPQTALHGCYKMPSASYLVIDTGRVDKAVSPKKYWTLAYEPKLDISLDRAREILLELFKNSVEKRLVSDVPLGIFLSGGIDSSSILAMMAEKMPASSINSFSIGFFEKSFDESTYARQVADFFGTNHKQQLLTAGKMVDLLPLIIEHLDEPFADPSIIPTFLLCKFAKQHITVALSGDGGDEIFAGYDSFDALKISPILNLMPDTIIDTLKRLAHKIPVSNRNMALHFKAKHFLKGFSHYSKDNLELRNNFWLGAFTPDVLPMLLNMKKITKDEIHSIYSETLSHRSAGNAHNPVDRLIDNYINLYLHDDILVKSDRASMMNSLEVRSPFLDKKFAEFVNRLPAALKLKGFNRKYLLKKSVKGILPEAILKRAKKGFGIPLADWIQGPLKENILDTFFSNSSAVHGLLNIKFIQKLIEDHLNKRSDNRKEIWNLFVFEKWRQAHNL